MFYSDTMQAGDGSILNPMTERRNFSLTPNSELITDSFLDHIRQQYRLNWHGIHGIAHWQRVRENGLRLASLNGANPKIIEYFAFTHDSQRQNDGYDPQHGARASQWIGEQPAGYFKLSQEEMKLLQDACRQHTGGVSHPNLSVMTCWDADRLDLMRVGIRPNPFYLCTSAAKNPQIIEWAIARSISGKAQGF